MWVVATFLIASVADVLAGIVMDDWRVTCAMMACTFSLWVPFLCHWEPDEPRYRTDCALLSTVPGLGYIYVDDRRKAFPLVVLMTLEVAGFLMVFLAETDPEVEYAFISWMLLYSLSATTSVVGASRGAKEAGIESTDPAMEMNLRNEGRVIRIFTYVLTAVFVWLCFHYYPDNVGFLAYFMSVWALHVCLNLTVYAYREPFQDPGVSDRRCTDSAVGQRISEPHPHGLTRCSGLIARIRRCAFALVARRIGLRGYTWPRSKGQSSACRTKPA